MGSQFLTKDHPTPTALLAALALWSLNHWTTREALWELICSCVYCLSSGIRMLVPRDYFTCCCTPKVCTQHVLYWHLLILLAFSPWHLSIKKSAHPLRLTSRALFSKGWFCPQHCYINKVQTHRVLEHPLQDTYVQGSGSQTVNRSADSACGSCYLMEFCKLKWFLHALNSAVIGLSINMIMNHNVLCNISRYRIKL